MSIELIMQNVEANLALLLFVAILGEALTEWFKQILPVEFKDKSTYLLSMAVGIALVFMFKVNLFGFETGWGLYASYIIIGILVGRGSNYVNGFLKRIGIIQSGAIASIFGKNAR